jgi:hypothetical protein
LFRLQILMGYSVVNIADVEGAGPGGAVKFLRRELGVEAFGVNWFELPPNAEGREHNEADSQQEEVNIVVRGGGMYRIDGEEVPVTAPMIFRFDAETTRQPVAGPDGLTMIAVGARRGSYEARGPF